jgi:hypothetical protein
MTLNIVLKIQGIVRPGYYTKTTLKNALFESFPPSGVPKGERSEAESRNLFF